VWVGYDTPRQILPGSAYAGDVAVPLWAEFMKAATSNDKPEPLVPPRGIVTVQVCRLSGKRPSGGCDAVPVVDDNGYQSERSMVGPEYFVRGTEPDEHCHLHVGRSLFGQLAGFFGGGGAPAVENRAADAAPADKPPDATPVSPAQQAPEVAAAPAEPEKKRGFWSRIFGRRDKPDEKKDPAATRRPQ
jgi:membrane peptidoglycan carboxypeptidase